jgi:D-glycero-alpha-D-manno-heptose 1-phosphate guanylyltransferase
MPRLKSNKRQINFENVDVLILCGGKGERLRPVVAGRPKVLALVGGRPFLEILIEYFLSHGFKRIILSVGYLKNHIIEYFEVNGLPEEMLKIEFSEEEVPLGTGGAIKKARPLINSDHFLVANGDSHCPVDLLPFYENHLNEGALLSLVLSKMEEAGDYGSVEIDDKGRILSFKEKDKNDKNKLVSAGIYLMRKDIFNSMPEADSFSLEHDFLPGILDKHCYGFVSEHQFIDIGTPERYEKAKELFVKPPDL